ncbi:DNA-directed RNA polymerase III subunit RPC7-like [Coregonus clupeaformis]|uniref:DNA-directed RNA polymerase III subunit RPC7-like n=1 Tax=Coregonus clupeaformis TaxID=59861 RepID=UPI001BE09ED4|nr:DNA-directed RNA polymerase III subunit RPC7-like [Coregonus clupeaformis]XP_045064315.1 DNA-directed RNA polymerase III subunit RPC7-like [Coregonus clupeaformis]XP_045064316.1 DNA-directed RNA polymerase III subunit RPC7-like [Coregonus clupeaformis]
MAGLGRGRGRGKGYMSFSIEAVGIGKGENLPSSILQPTPLFPPMEHKPVPLVMGEEAEYMLSLKQEFRGAMKILPFYVLPAVSKKDVERYSDKYQNSEPSDNTIEWNPDWKRLPKELRIHVKKPLKENTSLSVETPVDPKPSKKTRVDKEEIIHKLETLEKKEEEVTSDEEEGEKKKQEEEQQDGEGEYDEEEFEEETDYIMSYFDNGEEFGGDSDDNMDEAIY